ncbi:hypothetical protein ACF0H5_024126 [Mactra antiquata]
MEQPNDVQEREALERSIHQDTQLPTVDWSLKILLLSISKELTDNDLEDIKHVFSGQGGLGKGVLEKIKRPTQLFSILIERRWLIRDNLLPLQAALKATGHMNLVRRAAEYAQKIDNVLHFYPQSKVEDGFSSVKFHIYGRNYKNATRDDIQAIRMKIAELLFCPPQDICIAGVEPATSFILILHIPESYMVIFKDLLKTTTCKARLNDIGIDIIEIEGEDGLIHCSDEGLVSKSRRIHQNKLYNVYQQLEEKTKLLDSAEVKLLELKCEACLNPLITQTLQSDKDVSSSGNGRVNKLDKQPEQLTSLEKNIQMNKTPMTEKDTILQSKSSDKESDSKKERLKCGVDEKRHGMNFLPNKRRKLSTCK